MWELDYKQGWVPKNWCFWTVVLEKTLESPLDCKEIKPVIPKEINSEYSLEGLMLTLNLQYFGHLMCRADSLEKTLMVGKIEGRKRSGGGRGWDGWMASSTQGHEFNKLWEMVKDREAWRAAVHTIPKSRTRLSNRTTTIAEVVESKTFGQSAVTDLKFNCQPQAHLFQRQSRDRDCAEVYLGLPSRAFFF